MVWYKMRKDKLVSEEGIRYVGYGVEAFSGLRRVKSIKDVSLEKGRLKKKIKEWNQCHIKLKHLDKVVEAYVENESLVEEKPFSLV